MARVHASAWRSSGLTVSHIVVREDRGPLVEAPDAERVLDARFAFEDEGVGIVSVCTPGSDHAHWATRALESGKDVLVEKPIATSLTAARRMIRASSASRGLLAVGHVLRFDDGYRDIEGAVLAGRLGVIRAVHASRSIPWPGLEWWDDVRRSGGPIVDLGIHDLDQVALLLGWPASVRAREHENGAILIRLAGAAVADVVTSFHDDSTVALDSHIRVEGDSGLIEYRHRVTQHEVERVVRESSLASGTVDWHPDNDPFADQARYVRTCAEQRRQPAVGDPGPAVRALGLALAARRSLASGRTVTLPPAER